MNCWEWTTWANRWKYYEKDVDKLITSFTKRDIKKFNLDGEENVWGQVLANKKGKINTWAIFEYATIFKHNGLCLNPSKTFVKNIGHDGSGVHCGDNDIYKNELCLNKSIKFLNDIQENIIALERIKNFYKSQKKTLFVKGINKLSRVFFG